MHNNSLHVACVDDAGDLEEESAEGESVCEGFAGGDGINQGVEEAGHEGRYTVAGGDGGGGMMMTAITMLMVMKGLMFVQMLPKAHACEWEHYVTGSAMDCCCCCCRRGAVFDAVFSDEEGVWDLRPRNCRALEPVTAAAAAADAAALEGILENTLDAREEAYSFRSSAGAHVVL